MHGDPSQTHILSDLIGGLTANKCVGRYRHDVEYWEQNNSLEQEAFTHFLGMTMTGSQENIAAIKSVFPNAYSEFIATIGGLL